MSLKMDDRTLEALKGSIAKWTKIKARRGRDQQQTNCPLCLLFNPPDAPLGMTAAACNGCPVYDKTGKKYCIGTPYADFAFLDRRAGSTGTIPVKGRPYSVAMRAAARAELDFLRSLLPEGEPA